MIRASTRRMYRRVPTNYQVCYTTSSAFLAGVVRDLSLNGFRVRGAAGLSRNAIVMLRLWLPNDAGVLDIDQAIVRWVEEGEFGVQIIALSNEADLRLALHVEHLLQGGGGVPVASSQAPVGQWRCSQPGPWV